MTAQCFLEAGGQIRAALAIPLDHWLPRWLSGKESTCHCKRHWRHEFDVWVRKIPWSRQWQSTPEFLTERGAWWVTVHGVLKRFSDWTTATTYSVWCDHIWGQIWWLSSIGCLFFLITLNTFLALKRVMLNKKRRTLSPNAGIVFYQRPFTPCVFSFHTFFHSSYVGRYQLAGHQPLYWVVFWEEFIHRI